MIYFANNTCQFDADRFLKEPANEEECLSKEEVITTTLFFENGFTMDVKCCGVCYEPGASNSAWTEAVLFNKSGMEVACSEVGEEYYGEWILEYNGDEYHGLVNRKDGSHVYSH